MPSNLPPVLRQLARFLAVGGVATVVDVGVFNGLNLGMRVDPVVAKAVSTAAGAVMAYAGNRLWSFAGSAGGVGREVARYVVATVASLLVATLPVYVARALLDLRGAVAMNIAANVVGLGLATAFRFYVYREWVFAPTGRGAPAGAPA